jgi:hypothetical protein
MTEQIQLDSHELDPTGGPNSLEFEADIPSHQGFRKDYAEEHDVSRDRNGPYAFDLILLGVVEYECRIII